jgi:nitroreductase
MLDIFLNRRTQRAFTNDAIPQEHIDSILTAGCSAPSKQRAYPWRVIALTQSHKALELKNKLFLDSFINMPIRKHLLTAQSPLLLAWIGVPILDNFDLGLVSNGTTVREQGINVSSRSADPKTQYTVRTRSEKDTMIAASFSMIQAESLGYRTAFTSCFFEDQAHKILGLAENEWPVVFLSVGQPDDSRVREIVNDGPTTVGFSDPRPFPEPPKLTPAELSTII